MKLLVVKKQLLTRGKDEVFPAIHAFEYLVLEFHDPVTCRRNYLAGNSRPPRKSTDLPGPGHHGGLLQLRLAFGGGKGLLERECESHERRDTNWRHRGPAIVLQKSAGPGQLAILLEAPCCQSDSHLQQKVL